MWGAGNHRGRLAVLTAAIAGAAWLIFAPLATKSTNPGSTAGSVRPLTKVWPQARVATSSMRLADGASYAPAWYLPAGSSAGSSASSSAGSSAGSSIGTAPTADGTALRLLLRKSGDPAGRELRRLSADRAPQFAAVTADDHAVYWAESSATETGSARTSIWRAALDGSASPVLLVPDAGDATFFNSGHDLEVADGAVHWVVAGPVDRVATDLRSVPVGGGPVTTRTLPGAYALSAWPWLVSTGGPRSPVDLLNLTTGARIQVPTSATETVVCGPVWCRVRVVAASGVSRLDLMRPDGSDRHRIAGGTATSSAPDVALLDRFEVLTSGSGTSHTVQLYDEKTRTTAAVATNAGTVIARGSALWWSTATEWHLLDLSSLP